MKSIKVLLSSCVITYITLISISTANANPTVKVQHLNVTNTLTNKFNSYDIISTASEIQNNLSVNYRNSLSTGLFMSNPALFNKKSAEITTDIVNKSNDFFISAMIFNDKLHQLISYFTIPSNESMTKSPLSTTESTVIKQKCNSKLNFS
ncbi:hypothetical protein CXF85_01715 [Colwellia sp. 75C3]|uniref:hypothetical protein n=1 Tax=Colwellia sp. 75C3 TaxID=888425 RepID=UPI000C3285BE|nr:hypothetical protein [Colwellia sp. 75C3]PKG86445.1 hypothetical protein CXF85_01715 [Colwellia sp. 75C3]